MPASPFRKPSMTLEAILAYLHLLAILTMVVFIASEAALCRVQWQIGRAHV